MPMRYDFSDEFKELTNGEINRDVMGPEQNKLLRKWIGRGVRGARDAISKSLPSGLDEKTLRAYHEIARRNIADDNDPRGTQAARIELIEQMIDEIQRTRNTE